MRGFFHLVLYAAKYLILFPTFAFFWFAVLTLILALLSRDRAFADILLIALATVSAIRVTAYFNEDLSRDLAKILPFAVLAIFLIDGSYFDIRESMDILNDAFDHSERIFYYLVFLIAIELALRLVLAVVALFDSDGRRTRALEKQAVHGGTNMTMPPSEDPLPEDPSREEENQGDDATSTPQSP